jgi:hypothetical protein
VIPLTGPRVLDAHFPDQRPQLRVNLRPSSKTSATSNASTDESAALTSCSRRWRNTWPSDGGRQARDGARSCVTMRDGVILAIAISAQPRQQLMKKFLSEARAYWATTICKRAVRRAGVQSILRSDFVSVRRGCAALPTARPRLPKCNVFRAGHRCH